jgi:hypothetical protein
MLVGKPFGKRPLGRSRRRWENNIKADLEEVGCGGMDWIELEILFSIPSPLHVSMSTGYLQGALFRSLPSYTKTVHALLVVLDKKPLHSLVRVVNTLKCKR